MSGSRQSDTACCTSEEGVRSTSMSVLRMSRICRHKHERLRTQEGNVIGKQWIFEGRCFVDHTWKALVACIHVSELRYSW